MVARAANMSQAGQYNLPRSLKRGETVATELALAEFVRHGMGMIYLLNHRYAPFYKWLHRGLENMEILGETRGLFAKLMDGNAGETDRTAAAAWEEKLELVEQICSLVSAEWQRQGLIRPYGSVFAEQPGGTDETDQRSAACVTAVAVWMRNEMRAEIYREGKELCRRYGADTGKRKPDPGNCKAGMGDV